MSTAAAFWVAVGAAALAYLLPIPRWAFWTPVGVVLLVAVVWFVEDVRRAQVRVDAILAELHEEGRSGEER